MTIKSKTVKKTMNGKRVAKGIVGGVVGATVALAATADKSEKSSSTFKEKAKVAGSNLSRFKDQSKERSRRIVGKFKKADKQEEENPRLEEGSGVQNALPEDVDSKEEIKTGITNNDDTTVS